MILALFSAAALALGAAGATGSNDRVTVIDRSIAPNGWTRVNRASPETAVSFVLYLKQVGLQDLDQAFHAISQPSSPRYGSFLSAAEVDEMVHAAPEAFAATDAWLAAHLPGATIRKTADTIRVSSTVGAVLGAGSFGSEVDFHQYTHRRSGAMRLILTGRATLPAAVATHVSLVGGLSEGWEGSAWKRANIVASSKNKDKIKDKIKPAYCGSECSPPYGGDAACGKKGEDLCYICNHATWKCEAEGGRTDFAAATANQRTQSSNGNGDDDNDLKVTPQLLRSFYDIPEDEANASPDNYQCVAAFNDYFSNEALSKFYETVANTTTPTVDVMGKTCLDAAKPCDQVESDLDVQYMTVVGAGTHTLFHNINDEDGWVVEFSENAAKLSPLPKVFSISYGWAELKQCDIAFSPCEKLGYDSKAYVERTNTNFQKLATMGASILVSDGDDGAQSVQPSGENPLDPDHWCPDYWSCYPKNSSKCGEVVLKNTTTGDTCVFPVGTQNDHCSWLFLGDFYQDETIVKALKTQNPSCNIQSFIDGDYGSHLYSTCGCADISLTHEDVVAMPLKLNSSERLFWADFPTSSPYVTSVGATIFKTADGKTVAAEHAASIKDGAIITTGGGFSAVADLPSWQSSSVGAWASSSSAPKPPPGTYDATKRGYPDVSMNGHNYQVWAADNKKDSCPCSQHGVDGTSASSPAFAGLISLINGHLLKAGKSQLGFLNPALYEMAAKAPTAFKDVTVGDNKCTRDYCMQYGFEASTG